MPVTPCRLVDTRNTYPAVYQNGGVFTTGEIRTYTMEGGNGVCLTQLPSGLQPGAVQLQVFAMPVAGASGDVEVLPQGATFGSTATLVYLLNNMITSSSTASAVNVANNQISVQVRGGGSNLAMDVVGYFQAAVGATGPTGATGATEAPLEPPARPEQPGIPAPPDRRAQRVAQGIPGLLGPTGATGPDGCHRMLQVPIRL